MVMSLYINLIISVVYFEQSPFFPLQSQKLLFTLKEQNYLYCVTFVWALLSCKHSIYIYILYKNSKTLATLIFSFGTFNDSWLVWTEIDQKYSQCSSAQMAHKPV